MGRVGFGNIVLGCVWLKTQNVFSQSSGSLPVSPDQGRRRDFKSGDKRDSRAERSKKIVPHFSERGGTSKQIIISIEYTEFCCLVVALINMS